jgi:hypothetical protein
MRDGEIVGSMGFRFYGMVAAAALAVAGLIAGLVVLVFGHTGGKPRTKAQYIAEVNAVCRSYNAKLSRIPAPIAVGNARAVARSIGRALPIVVERAEKVRAIPPPAVLKSRVARLFRLADRALDELRRSRRAALARDLRKSGQALGRFLAFSDEAHQVAIGIGLSC